MIASYIDEGPWTEPGTVVARGRELLTLNHAGQWLFPGIQGAWSVTPRPDQGWKLLRYGYGEDKGKTDKGPILVWIEGYRATGEHGTATSQLLHGKIDPESGTVDLDDAMLNWKQNDEEAARSLRKNEVTGQWSFWGCRIFDNEQQARESFG
jgi:hypothetical protein